MLIEVSTGELVDKITILQIKKERINNIDQLKNINYEYNILYRLLCGLNIDQILYNKLQTTNTMIWDYENIIRQKEIDNCFDLEFIRCARGIYKFNDLRAKIKRKINESTNSNVIEEKSFLY